MNLDRNDIKMSTIETNYYYNGNNVTCELVATVKAPKVFNDVFGNIYKVVKATAKCHKDDTYSEECGKKIALARAESKAYHQINNEINRRWNYLLEAIETLLPYKKDFAVKTEKSIDHNDVYVKELPSKY